MNSAAIVMAADSTVTIRVNGSKVHYHDVEKIFGLSHFHSVGVMVNGVSHFFGIPWEVVVKMYREEPSCTQGAFPKLDKYVATFKTFLGKLHGDLKTGNYLEKGSYEKLGEQLEKIKADFKKSCGGFLNSIFEKHIDNQDEWPRILDAYVQHLRQEVTESLENFIRAGHDIRPFREVAADLIKADRIRELITRSFGLVRIDETLASDLIALAGISSKFIRDENNKSIILFCGYGKDEFMPRMIQLDVHYILGLRFDAEVTESRAVGPDSPAEFRAYGESEIVDTFLTGTSRQFLNDLRKELESKVAASTAASPTGAPSVAMLDEFDSLSQKVQAFIRGQILKSVEHLPKHFLGNMAEKLISISSIKSHVKDVDGSVGGAVSVAIISKGEGLVWIHRPHYFDLGKNPHFMTRRTFQPTSSAVNGKLSGLSG